MKIVDLATLTPTQLAAAYNELSAIPVRRFADAATALRRTSALLAEKGWMLVATSDGDELTEDAARDAIHVSTNLWLVDRGTVEKAEQMRKEAAAPPKTQRVFGRERAASWPEDAVIRLLVDHNPKRGKSAAAYVFALYRDRMTVGQFLDAAYKTQYYTKPRAWFRTDLRYNVAHGYIRIVPAGQES